MTSTISQLGHETLASDVIAGKGKRVVVEASDDYTVSGRQWHVRIWELRQEAGRGEVREARMCVKAAGRAAAVALAEQVAAKVRQQVA